MYVLDGGGVIVICVYGVDCPSEPLLIPARMACWVGFGDENGYFEVFARLVRKAVKDASNCYLAAGTLVGSKVDG